MDTVINVRNTTGKDITLALPDNWDYAEVYTYNWPYLTNQALSKKELNNTIFYGDVEDNIEVCIKGEEKWIPFNIKDNLLTLYFPIVLEATIIFYKFKNDDIE